MTKFTIHKIVVIFLMLSAYLLVAKEPIYFFSQGSKKSRIAHTRISIAPVISFYKINKNHASAPKQKMSGVFCVKEEFRLNSEHTMFFSIGAEYFLHGVNFFSYYFKPDSIKLYTGEMNYAYSLYIHELDIPLQLRISFKRENNAIFTPYVMVGYHFRTMLFGNLKVKENGNQIIKKQEEITFKNPLITKLNNPFVSIAIGMQKNNPDSKKMGVFAELGFKFGFSPYLLKNTFTPSSMYINGHHLSLGFGIKI